MLVGALRALRNFHRSRLGRKIRAHANEIEFRTLPIKYFLHTTNPVRLGLL